MAKKLKTLSSGIISYVQIEGEAAKDAADKHIITSYAHQKLDEINWYIELLDVGSKKYIVPQSREQLVSLKNKLESVIEKIMDIPLPKAGRANVSIGYPEGYEG